MRTDKQEAFIESYCLTGNAAKAAEMAGYSPKASKQKGYALKKQFAHEIAEKTREMMADAIPGVLAKLPKFLNATFKEMAKHITMADAGGDAIAKNMATTLGGGSLDSVAARKFVEGRVAGLLGHHLDKDKWGAQ